MNRPLYIMLIGLPGSGKSYLAEQIFAAFTDRLWCWISTDNYVDQVAEAAKKTYSEVFAQVIDGATQAANADRKLGFKLRENIVHDQTNLTVSSRAKKLASVPKGYAKIGIWCQVSEPMRQARLAERPGKVIPQDVDKRMVASLEQPTLAEGFHVAVCSSIWRQVIEAYTP